MKEVGSEHKINKKIMFEKDSFSIYIKQSRKNDSGGHDFNKITSIQGQYGLLYDYFKKSTTYPIVTWFWVQNTDLMVREHMFPFSQEIL